VDFLDVADALEDVGDVVDSSFLHVEFIDGVVEVDGGLFACFYEFDEFFGED
jgi:hypothetical protein